MFNTITFENKNKISFLPETVFRNQTKSNSLEKIHAVPDMAIQKREDLVLGTIN